jgi:glycosyltransferase involved in cell wall biosynthesis
VDPWLVLRLARLISRAGIDVVHTHNVTPWLYAGLAARLAGARLVHTEHSNLFPHQRRLMAAERWLARLTDVIISDSDKVRRGLLGQRLPAERIRTIVNGIDTARFAGREPSQALRASVGVAPGQPVLGAVGRLVPVKDHETLLRAFAEVCRQRPEAVLVLVGDGPQRALLEQLAQQLGVAPAVRFAGEVPDVAPWLALLDVFVLPSLSEGMPLTLLESMAAGVPAVATRVGGIAEALLEGETGLLVPPKDPQALAQALLRLLGDEPLRKRLGAQAQQRARKAFDVRTMVRAYEDTYHHELVP